MSQVYRGVLTSLMIVASALAVAAPASAAPPLIVCDSGCAYTSIQTAIDAAVSGDTVLVRPGSYAESLNIQTPITVCSTVAGGGACESNPDGVTLVTNAIYPVWIEADDVTFQGFTIDNSDYTGVDVGAAWVDPSAIVVYGVDGVVVADNVIEAVASIPLPGESRRYVVGVNIATGADDLSVLRNTMVDIPPAASGPCANAPCLTVGIFNWGGGSGFLVEGNDIRPRTSAEPAYGISFDGNANTIIRDNFIRMPSSAPGSGATVVGIDAGATDGALIEDNNIATSLVSAPGGLYGIWGIFSNTEFRGNLIQLAQHGIVLRSNMVGGNEIVDNDFRNSNQGVLNYADGTLIEDNSFATMGTASILLDAVDVAGGPYSQSENVVIHGNLFDNSPTALGLSDTVTTTDVDARFNDWSAYSSDLIASRINDASGSNDVDFSCFIDEDGVTEVCPLASFTTGLSATWPRIVTLTDTSTFPGSELGEREWTLPGGATSDEAIVTLSLDPGSYSFDLRVVDGEGFEDSASQALLLTNTAPAFSLAGPYAATEGTLLSFALGATDAEGDALTYTLLAGPAGMSVAGGILSWTPGFATAGSYPFTVRVSDGNLAVAASSSVDVTDVPVGAPIGAIANVNINELASATRAVTATSPAGAPIALSATGLPPGATFTDNGGGSGSFAITAPSGSAGVYAVTIEALSEGITTTKTFNVAITLAVGLTLERLSPTTVQTSPGQVVTLKARVTNIGSGSDTMRLSMTGSRPWPVALPADPALASGTSALVDVLVTIPAGADAGFFTLKACSTSAPTLCKTLLFRIEVPIVLSLEMDPTFGLLVPVNGTIHATYLSGAPAPGVSVTFTERHRQNVWLLTSSVSGTTDATGAFAFVDDDAMAMLPGDHTVLVSAENGDVDTSIPDDYEVAP